MVGADDIVRKLVPVKAENAGPSNPTMLIVSVRDEIRSEHRDPNRLLRATKIIISTGAIPVSEPNYA